MAELNKNILFGNISYLLKMEDRKIGELEKDAGVSKGYISRTREGDNKPSVDFVMKIASSLKIGIDVLLKVNLSALTPSDEYLLRFLEKLTNDTIEDKLDWKTESAEALTPAPDECNFEHPLFTTQTIPDEPVETDSDLVQMGSGKIFESNSFGINTAINGNCYHLDLGNDVTVYLMDIKKANYKANDPDVEAKEIWLYQNGTENAQFVCSNNDGSQVAVFVDELFTVVTGNAKHPKLGKPFKNAIDAFLEE